MDEAAAKILERYQLTSCELKEIKILNKGI